MITLTRLEARRKLADHGQDGNWRLKGLLLAGLSGSGVSMESMGKAWPTKPSDYRFLAQNDRYDPEEEAKARFLAEEGSREANFLADYAEDALTDADVPDHALAGADTEGLVTAQRDQAIQHALFAAATPEELDVLFRKEIGDTVAEGAQKRQAAREGAFIYNADTNQGEVTVAEDRQYAYNSDPGTDGVAEGGIIPDDREGYSTVSWDCIKVAQGARVTDEMVRHARVDIIERQIEHLGEAVENGINRIWLNELVDNSGQSFQAAGSGSRGVPAINGGIRNVDEQDFQPDTLVTHPRFRQELFDDTNLVYVNRAGGDDSVLQDRTLDGVMGVEHLPMNNAAYDSGSNTWDYSSTSEIGAVVYQQEHIWLVIEQDIEVKEYEDPIRDIQGVNARAWVDAKYAQTDAAADINRD